MFLIKFINFIVLLFSILLTSCTKIRESAGVTRKSLDEFQIIENPPLIIPPDFNLSAPGQLNQKNIDNTEQDLAQEILFGLNEKEQDIKKQNSTINMILSRANASNISNDIREEIDQEFSQEKKMDGIFQIDWENEVEVLDAVKESERIRNKNFTGEKISDGELPMKKEKVKIKKKKRFLFF